MRGSHLYTNPGADLAAEASALGAVLAEGDSLCPSSHACLPRARWTKPRGSERLPEIPAGAVQQPRNVSLLPVLQQSYSRMDFPKVLPFQEREKIYPWVKACKQPKNYSEECIPLALSRAFACAQCQGALKADTRHCLDSRELLQLGRGGPGGHVRARAAHWPRTARFPGCWGSFCSQTCCPNSGLLLAGETAALLNSVSLRLSWVLLFGHTCFAQLLE